MALTINGEQVEPGLIEQEFSAIKAHFESLGNVSCCERDQEFRGYARQNIIARVLLAQEAERAIEPPGDEQIDQAIEQLKAEHGGEKQFYAATGVTPDQTDVLRQQVSTHLRMQKLAEQVTAQDGEASETELRAFYEKRIDLYKTVEEVRASHILKSPRLAEERNAAYEALRAARQRLLAGGDFEKEAAAHSDKPAEETDLGFFKRGEILEEFERIVFSMNVDEISPVFLTPFGFHLVKCTGHKPSVPRPFEEVRDEVREHYLQSRREHRMAELVEKLKAAATIEQDAEEEEQAPTHAH